MGANRREFLRSALSVGALASVDWSAAEVLAWAASAPIKRLTAKATCSARRECTSSPEFRALGHRGADGTIEPLGSRHSAAYKRESLRWNIRTVSMGGSLPAGGRSIQAEQSPEDHPRRQILAAWCSFRFRETCPKMDDEAS